MKLIQIIAITLAFAVVPFAAADADDKGKGKSSSSKKPITAPAVKQGNAASSRDEDMEGFLETVVAVLDDDTRSEESADNVADDKDNRNQGHLERNVGLGFAHGMGNNGNNGNGNPHNGACNGNGHPGNPNSNGNNGGNGRGHDNHQGNGFGHRDCGEPSPAD